ncbi:MAG: hypothetical protein ACHP9T_15530 [Caulobacterales bacterium]|jgi:hypothetical protein
MSLETPPEIHAPHAHHGGGLPRWLEWVTSISALVVSISSIVIAVHHGDAMDRLVQANSYPYLDFGPSNGTPEGGHRFSIDLMNHGVGPAHEQSLTIRVGDHYASSIEDLIASAVGAKDAHAAMASLKPLKNVMKTRFIPANTTQFIFQFPETPENSRWWRMVNASAQTWQIDVCYCSVFKECWTRHQQEDPQPVKACTRNEAHEYTN